MTRLLLEIIAPLVLLHYILRQRYRLLLVCLELLCSFKVILLRVRVTVVHVMRVWSQIREESAVCRPTLREAWLLRCSRCSCIVLLLLLLLGSRLLLWCASEQIKRCWVLLLLLLLCKLISRHLLLLRRLVHTKSSWIVVVVIHKT